MKLRRLMQIARRAKAYQGRRCASQQNWSPNDRYGSNSEQLRVSISRPRCAQQRTSGYGSGIGRVDLARNESAAIDGLFRDGNARPGGNLNARGQKVRAVLGTERRRVALLHLEPSLAERVDDVRLVRDRNHVGAALRRQRQLLGLPSPSNTGAAGR
jgi:hypothetical protein